MCFVVFIVLSREEYNVGPVCSSPVVLLLALFPTPQVPCVCVCVCVCVCAREFVI